MALRTIEICAGVGMLGEGLRAGLQHLGRTHRAACYLEREAYPAAVIAARCEEGSLDPAPVWSDLLTFDAAAWYGAVDCIAAGFPCQDLSLAGKRAGLDGKRSGLFFNILDIADACGAWLLFLENVAGIASATASVVDEAEGDLEERAAARVLGELADRGWNAEWLTLSASDVGASHGRERWFCLAWRQPVDDAQRAQRRQACATGTGGQQWYDRGWAEAHGGSGEPVEILEHTPGERRREAWQCCSAGVPGVGQSSAGMAHPECSCDRAQEKTADCGRNPQAERPADQHSGLCGACVQAVADTGCGDAWRIKHVTGAGRSSTEHHSGSPAMADAGRAGFQGNQQCSAHDADGRTDGRSRNHADQLPNFIMMNFSHPAPQIPDGQESSSINPTSPRRLNPIFGELLMGWRLQWTKAEPSASSASATVLYRLRLQQHLSCLLEGQES